MIGVVVLVFDDAVVGRKSYESNRIKQTVCMYVCMYAVVVVVAAAAAAAAAVIIVIDGRFVVSVWRGSGYGVRRLFYSYR